MSSPPPCRLRRQSETLQQPWILFLREGQEPIRYDTVGTRQPVFTEEHFHDHRCNVYPVSLPRHEPTAAPADPPEVYDKHMAIYYANVVMSLVESGSHGVMAAYRDGAFISTDIPGKNLPARRVNPADYHTTRYRPRFEHISGSYRAQE